MLLDTKLLKKAGVFTIVSGELVVLVMGGYKLGEYLDGRWGSTPWLAITLATLGLCLSVWRIIGYSKAWLKE